MRWLPYEGKLRIFLVLLVLLMVLMVFFQSQVLLRAQQELLREATNRVRMVTEEFGRGVRGMDLEAPDLSLTPADADSLRRRARKSGLLSLDLIDGEGTILWSSLSTRVGRNVPVSGKLGGKIYLPSEEAFFPYSSRFTYLPGRGFRWRLEHPTAAIDGTRRQLRVLSWLQALSVSVALISSLLFARWTLHPYRRLLRTAERAAGVTGDTRAVSDQPDFLLNSFRGVLKKLQVQEGELAELRPRAESPFLENTLDQMVSGVLSLRGDGTIARVNPAAERYLGIGGDRLVNLDYRQAFRSSGRLREILRGSLEEHRTRSREVVPFSRPNGLLCHLGVSVSPILGADGKPSGVICLLTDLTEIRAVEERVRNRETLATVGEWSAGMAHEFRNNLGTILGLARLWERRAVVEERETVSAILEEVRGADRTVEDFLRFARPAKLRFSRVPLGDFLKRISTQMVQEFPGRLSILFEGEFPSLQADPDLLRQAFRNLLRNAAEAGGRPGTPTEVRIRGGKLPGTDRIVVEIADSGPGIPTEELPHLFTPFFSTKGGGTGLGLPLARKAILSHDGEIRVESSPGSGTCFRIELPIEPEEAGPTDRSLGPQRSGSLPEDGEIGHPGSHL